MESGCHDMVRRQRPTLQTADTGASRHSAPRAAVPGRTFRQYLTTNYHQINRRHPDAGPDGLGCNSVNWIVEQITATQQMGTHMDGLNHLQEGDQRLNGSMLRSHQSLAFLFLGSK
jgi:hypothetical protein